MQNVDISVNVLGVDDDRDIISIRTSKFCSQHKHCESSDVDRSEQVSLCQRPVSFEIG